MQNYREISDLLESAKSAAFALESVAHLTGKEKFLLPIADELREAIEAVENLPPF